MRVYFSNIPYPDQRFATCPSDEGNKKQELERFNQTWLADEAFLLKQAHTSGIVSHLNVLSSYEAGSPEFFTAIEDELMKEDAKRIKACSATHLMLIVKAFSERSLGSTAFYNTIIRQMVANDGAYVRDYIFANVHFKILFSFPNHVTELYRLSEMITRHLPM